MLIALIIASAPFTTSIETSSADKGGQRRSFPLLATLSDMARCQTENVSPADLYLAMAYLGSYAQANEPGPVTSRRATCLDIAAALSTCGVSVVEGNSAIKALPWFRAIINKYSEIGTPQAQAVAATASRELNEILATQSI